MRVYIGDMLLGESRQTQVSGCPELLWQVGYVECRNEDVEYSLGRGGFGSHIPDFHPSSTFLRDAGIFVLI